MTFFTNPYTAGTLRTVSVIMSAKIVAGTASKVNGLVFEVTSDENIFNMQLVKYPQSVTKYLRLTLVFI